MFYREISDLISVISHITLIAYLNYDHMFIATTTYGTLLYVMEIVALLFHSCYIFIYYYDDTFRLKTNPWKWLEYAVTATLGTVAVGLTDVTLLKYNSVMVLVVFTSITTQTIGYLIEELIASKGSFVLIQGGLLMGSLLQIGEYLILADGHVNPNVFWTYVIVYSMFGILMSLIVVSPRSYISRPQVNESLFSILGTFSKVFVVTAALERNPETFISSIVASGIFLGICIYTAIEQPPPESL